MASFPRFTASGLLALFVFAAFPIGCGGDADYPCGTCVFEPGDVVAIFEERYPTPELGTSDYLEMAESCPVIVLDRIMPPDPEARFNHTILITERGSWETAGFIHATDPGGVFEARLADWVTRPQTACGWRFVRAEVYRRPDSFAVTRRQAVQRAQSYLGESYAVTKEFLKPETWAHFRDDPDAQLLDVISLESYETALAILGEFAWDFILGEGDSPYDQPRYCGKSRTGTTRCGTSRYCNQCPDPGRGTKYCSELAWWAYGGDQGENAAGDLAAGATGQVPDLFVHTTSILTTWSHTSEDLALNFELKCEVNEIPDLWDLHADCP